jgi:hypothetical protein
MHNILNKIILENFPNLEKELPIQVQEAAGLQTDLTKIESLQSITVSCYEMVQNIMQTTYFTGPECLWYCMSRHKHSPPTKGCISTSILSAICLVQGTITGQQEICENWFSFGKSQYYLSSNSVKQNCGLVDCLGIIFHLI